MKILLVILSGIFAVIFALAFIACDQSDSPVTCTVTFDLDGGNIDGDTANLQRTVNSGGTVADIPSNPIKTDNIFDGWFTQKNGAGTEFTTSTPVTADIIVFSKWKTTIVITQTFTVIFNTNGGTPEPQQQIITEGSMAVEPDTPTKAGYDCIFEGWYDESLTTRFAFSTSITTDINLYAKWRPYELGETGPAGGIIFYRDETGFIQYEYADDEIGVICHYLEAAPTDIDTQLEWINSALPYPGVYEATEKTYEAFGIGMGRKNTALLLSITTTEYNIQTPAAQACNDYSYGGKIDWFLPSKDELNMLYINRTHVSNMKSEWYYCSCGIVTTAGKEIWGQHFESGNQSSYYPNPFLFVRAIRAF